ncbi:tetratricopeptide repeat protein, partial [Micromonospora sp. LOL_013]
QRALAITESALGPSHPDTAIHLGNLAAAYRGSGRAAEAIPLLQRALAITESALGPSHPDTAIRLGNLAATYHDVGNAQEATTLLRRAVTIAEAALGPDHALARELDKERLLSEAGHPGDNRA